MFPIVQKFTDTLSKQLPCAIGLQRRRLGEIFPMHRAKVLILCGCGFRQPFAFRYRRLLRHDHVLFRAAQKTSTASTTMASTIAIACCRFTVTSCLHTFFGTRFIWPYCCRWAVSNCARINLSVSAALPYLSTDIVLSAKFCPCTGSPAKNDFLCYATGHPALASRAFCDQRM